MPPPRRREPFAPPAAELLQGPPNAPAPTRGLGLVLPPNGALPSKVLSLDVPAVDEVLVTDGVNSTWGVVPAAALTSVPAASLTGTIAEARLPLLDKDNFAQNAWTTYVPALTAGVGTPPTLGTGSVVVGRWVRQADRLIVVEIGIQFGTSGVAAGTGNYQVSLPVAKEATSTPRLVLGYGHILDNSLSAFYLIVAYRDSADTSKCFMLAETAGVITDASPFVWAASDEINLTLMYEAAS